MGYMEEAERWIETLLTDLADEKMSVAEVKRDIKSRILESYKNGLKAARQSPAPDKRGNRRTAPRAA